MREKMGMRRKRIRYFAVSKPYCQLGIGSYISYDIVSCDMYNASVVAEVRDVTTDRELAMRIVENFNRYQLSPDRMENVIDDILI